MATVNNYTRTTWQTGDVIDATKMNNIETQLNAVTNNARENGVAPVFSTTETYAVGEHVLYNGEVYRCKTAVTSAGAWVASNWTKASLSEDLEGEVSELKSALSSVDAYSGAIYKLNGYGISAYYNQVRNTQGSYSIWFQAEPNTTYFINRSIIAQRFLVASTETTPAANVATSQIIRNDSANSIEIATKGTDHFVVAMVFVASLDTEYTWDQIYNSISVYSMSANDWIARAATAEIRESITTLETNSNEAIGALDARCDDITRLTMNGLLTPEREFVQGSFSADSSISASAKRICSNYGFFPKGTTFEIICNAQYCLFNFFKHPIGTANNEYAQESRTWDGGNKTITFSTEADSYVGITVANGYNYGSSTDIVPSDYAMVISVHTALYDAYQPIKNITDYIAPFRFKACYDHLFVNDSTIIIPHESLYHVRISRLMGFDIIEANVSKTSDGVYVVNHFNSGKFGWFFHHVDNTTDISNMSVSSVTWQWIVDNVRYNSSIPKYRTRPSRLEEFLSECRQQNIIPFLQSHEAGIIEIADRYMGKNNYIAYDAERSFCEGGIISKWRELTTKSDILAFCRRIGKPFVYGMSNPTAFTDAELRDIIDALHTEGYWIAMSYADANWYKYSNMGVDLLGANASINRIDTGNICNLDSVFGFDDFVFTGATEDEGVLTYTENGTLAPNVSADRLSLGGVDLQMDFVGEITVPAIGSRSQRTFTSSGEYPFFATIPILNSSPSITISVSAGTIVRDCKFKASKF